jgi:hypothetical protein
MSENNYCHTDVVNRVIELEKLVSLTKHLDGAKRDQQGQIVNLAMNIDHMSDRLIDLESKGNERHSRQVDENRKISRRVDELSELFNGMKCSLIWAEKHIHDINGWQNNHEKEGQEYGNEFEKRDTDLISKIDHQQRMYEDHYRNHESLKTEFQLIVQAHDNMADHYERIAALEQHTYTNQDSTIMPRIDGHALQIHDLEKKIEALSKHVLTNWDELQRPINHQAVQMGILRERIKAIEDFNIKLNGTWSADIDKYQAMQTKTDDELISLGKLLDVLNMKLNLHGERIQTIEQIFEVKHYPNKTFTYSVGEMPLTSKDVESDMTSIDTKQGIPAEHIGIWRGIEEVRATRQWLISHDWNDLNARRALNKVEIELLLLVDKDALRHHDRLTKE